MLSIIIPTLNEEECLPRLLASIEEQDYSNYEIIISDANSEDSTVSIAKNNSCKVVIDQENKHPSFQRNRGVEIATGDIILFLDADTVLPPSFLSATLEEIAKRNLGIAGSYIKFNPNHCLYSIYAFFYNSFCFFRQYCFPASVGAGIIVRKDIHEKIGGFNTSLVLAEDFDYCYRASKVSKFRMLRSKKILYSSRRLEKEGKIRGTWGWLRMARYTVFNMKVKNKKIKYDMGGK